MEIRHNVAVSPMAWERLRDHCNVTGELMYRAVERYIMDGITKDHDNGRG